MNDGKAETDASPGLFSELNAVRLTTPDEYEAAQVLPESIFSKLYPHAYLGPAYPEILQMYAIFDETMILLAAKDDAAIKAFNELAASMKGLIETPEGEAKNPFSEVLDYLLDHSSFRRILTNESWDQLDAPKLQQAPIAVTSFLIKITFAVSAALSLRKVGVEMSVVSTVLDHWDAFVRAGLTKRK